MTHDRPRTLLPLFAELRGQRVIVRPYRLEDAAALQEAVAESRKHVRPWMPFADEHQTVDESRDFIIRCMARWLLRESLLVGLWDVETQRYVGGSGLHPRNWDAGCFEIGYWARASAEGKGYVSEAVRLLTDFAFASLDARRVMIRCDACNTHSAAVAERLGFVREGRLRQRIVAQDGTLRDMLVFSLIPSDPRWNA
jgi:RimJ/RimL family protein N-acetyltransferase